jgi:CheY-like chemotaxis protein
MVDVLRETSLDGNQVEMVNLIHESASSLLGIIDDILDFSKIEASRLEIETAPISVDDVIEKACGMLDHWAGKKDVELTLFIDPAIPEPVLGDGLRLRQVLLNLVGNAVKFSSGREQAGRVSVRAVLAEQSAQQVVVEIHVTDNGIGMDEATQARLFTAFTQADTSTTRRFGGTGLGLVISRHLVELMGGYFMLQSTSGNGSTFTMRLPFALLQIEAGIVKPASEVAGLCCVAIGGPDGLAENVAVYLVHGGARVERAADVAQARTLMHGLPPGPWIWIIDCANIPWPINELGTLAHDLLRQDIHIVAIRCGSRSEQPSEYVNLALADGNVLMRRSLLKAVSIAAGGAAKEKQSPPPSSNEAPFQRPSLDDADAGRKGQLILVAEDHETNQQVILRQLAVLGFSADVAENGRLALERWQSGNYTLLLTDLHMPEMDGYALTREIRKDEVKQGRAHTTIIAWTVSDHLTTSIIRCSKLG